MQEHPLSSVWVVIPTMIDFLEKGRKGMGSTLLVRLKIGEKLVDAKGVRLLYPHRRD